MNLAIDLALKAQGRTLPNPIVGAVVVKNGKIVGKGYHKKAGGHHAEVFALKQAGSKAKGAQLYVNLEPCSFHGKTPPCTDLIIKSKIKKVYIAVKDFNPTVNGKGIKILNRHGIKTHLGLLKERAKKINLPFFKYAVKKMPFVTTKTAQSLDGKITSNSGTSKWITSSVARNFAKKQRKFYDAIMVGINTVLKDNPKLTAGKKINKIVVDSTLKTPVSANIFKSKDNVIIATLKSDKSKKALQLKRKHKNILILTVKPKKGKIDLKDLLKKLAKMSISNVLSEGGACLNGALFDDGLVDKVNFYISPKIIGGINSLPSIAGKGIKKLDKAIELKNIKMKKLGRNLFIEGYV